MTTNPYFNQDDPGQQTLIEDITVELIQGTGRDVVYVPRQFVNIDKIFGEDIASNFSASYTIEAYVETFRGFDGTDIVNQFGIEVKDKLTLVLSKRRFEQEITAVVPSITRPREGDLIYFPLSGSLFEINFVEHENPFYPIGKRYTYMLTCEMFTYSMERVATGNTAIDQVYDTSYRIFYDMAIPGPSGATYFHEGQYVQQTGGSGGLGLISGWDGNANILTINILSGTFSPAFAFAVLGDTGGVYPTVGATFTSIAANPNRYPSYGTSKTLKGNNEDIEQERFANNVVPFNEIDPFSDGNY